MYKRALTAKIKELASKYPIVTVLGPRQSGKTTLVKDAFYHMPYVNLEDLEHRALASADPKSFIQSYAEGAIFDEIQRVPELLSAIQIKVDEVDKKGFFILTGSHQVDLHYAISQSLAGRTAVLKLLPMSLSELRNNEILQPLNTFILQGGYPRIYKDNLPIDLTFSSYFQTYVEKDIRYIIKIKDLLPFEKFIKLLASRVGQVINYSSLACDVGVSSVTIKEWISVLEASYLIFKLEPYFENFGKRIIKSPKIYFCDTGLLCYLLGIETVEQLIDDPCYGNIFENFTILELLKHSYNQAKDPHFYFYRDSLGKEVDLIKQQGSYLIPIKIKSSKTFSSHFIQGLTYFHTLSPDRAKNGFIIYGGDTCQKIQNYHLISVESCTDFF